MSEKQPFQGRKSGYRRPVSSNVKSRPKYERFGETIRYLTISELQRFFDCIEDYRHKLMFRMIYELGCRVGEFVRIQHKHLDFARNAVLFPAQNTKTRRARTAFLPRGLMNEIVSMLRSEGRMQKRDHTMRRMEEYLFHPPGYPKACYSENRIRQLFRRYARAADLDHEYGQDNRGRKLHRLSVHSLRHSHIMTYIHVHQLPLPIEQRQVGHKSLRSTSAYLKPSDEAVAEAYGWVQTEPRLASQGHETIRGSNL